MEKFKAEGLITHLSTRMDELCKEADRTEWRRSLLYFYARELEQSRKKSLARTIRSISSVLYTAQFCGQFRELPAFPSWYGKYLTKTTGISQAYTSHDVSLTELKTITLEHISPNIKPEAGEISIEDIIEIRKSPEFQSYREELEKCNDVNGIDKNSEASFVAALDSYLRFLDQRFGEIYSNKHKEKKRLQKQLTIIRNATPVGVVISLTSLIASILTQVPISWATTPIWNAITISFFLYKPKIEQHIKEIDIETAKFWSTYCSPGKTFAGSLTRSLPSISKRLQNRPLLASSNPQQDE